MALLFAVVWQRPFRVEGDVGYQAKAAQQFVQGRSPSLNTLVVVDPKDLARDQSIWLYWWPPAISVAFTPLLAVGLPVGEAGRTVAFLATLAGVIGWIRVAVLLLGRSPWRWLALPVILLYPVTSRLPFQLVEGDFVSFAVQPWFYHWAIRFAADSAQMGPQQMRRDFWIGSVLLGSVYWLKYSAIFSSMAVWAAIVVALLTTTSIGSKRALFVTVLGGLVLFCVPIMSLRTLNQTLAGSDLLQVQSFAAQSNVVSPVGVISRIVTGSGTALFGAGEGLSRLDRALSRLVTCDWALYLALPGFLLLLPVSYLLWRLTPRSLAVLGMLTWIVPLSGLGASVWLMGFPYVTEIGRHVLPAWVFLEILVIWLLSGIGGLRAAGAQSFRRDWFVRSCLWVCWAVFVYLVAASSFSVYRFVRYDIGRWRGRSYSVTSNRLYVPTWSATGVQPIRQLIGQASLGPRDIVVSVAPWLGMDAWLEVPERLLPMSNFSGPLGRSLGPDLNYSSDEPLRSSQPLRVVILVSNLYHRSDYAESVTRIKNRFPQAAEWRLLKGGRGAEDEVSIWTAELKLN